MLYQFLISLFKAMFKEKVNGEQVVIGDLTPHVEDERDFMYEDLGGTLVYQPKHERLVLKTQNVKNQYPNNTCCFYSYATCRESSENVALSPRSLVSYAKQKGYIRSNGISSLRESQQAGIEFGIAEETVVPNDTAGWDTYSGIKLSQAIKDNAAKHKGKSYFTVKSKNEWIKALDDGNPIQVGFTWYSKYNVSGGLRFPWILPWKTGVNVGGHAVACIGYDIPKGLFIFQNSFGLFWGDVGKFYIKMSDILKDGVAGLVTVDLAPDTVANLMSAYEGKDVKSTSNPVIYRIENGKKRPYPNESVFYAFGGDFEKLTYELVANSLLERFMTGSDMFVFESPFWGKLASEWTKILWMRYPDNTNHIKELIK